MKLKKLFTGNRTVNMLEGPILGRLLTFCLPIFLGSVFQQLYNMVDSVVVGRYVSSDALAAVGATTPFTMFLMCIMMGFNTGASIVASQLIGAEREEDVKPAISTTMIFLIGLSIAVSVLAFAFARPILHLMKVPENIIDQSLSYLRIVSLGLICTALYNLFASFLRAMGDSITPLIFLIISSLLNIGGDLFFVIVLKMGVPGVAWATIIAQAISAVLCIIYVNRTNPYFRFGKGEFRFDRKLFKSIFRLGLPSCLQMAISTLGMVVVQGLINSFGSVDIAAYTAANKMENLCNLPSMALAQGLGLFVGQNIGAGNVDRSKKGLWQAAGFGIAVSVVLSASIYLFGNGIMHLFVKAEDREVIDIGTHFMKIWAPLIIIHAASESLVAFLRGSGDSIQAMIAMFFDLGVRTIMAYLFVLVFNMGFYGIAWSIPCGWIGASIYALVCYLLGTWKGKAVARRS